mgnify:FL=1
MKRQIVFLTTLSFALIIYLVYDVHSKRIIIENYKNQNEELQNLNAEQSYVLENITILSKLQHFAEGHNLENYTLYTTDGDSCELKDVCKGEKLIYYFSEQGCQVCYQPFLKKLVELSKKIGKEHIVVIGKFEERRSFKLFLQNLTPNNDLTIYQTKTELNIYPEYNEYALAFQVTKDLAINNICITDKSNTELSADYLKLIEKKFNNSTSSQVE